eukprot:1131609-Amphidinium_carterae.1
MSGDVHRRKPAVPPNLHELAFGHRSIAKRNGLESLLTAFTRMLTSIKDFRTCLYAKHRFPAK